MHRKCIHALSFGLINRGISFYDLIGANEKKFYFQNDFHKFRSTKVHCQPTYMHILQFRFSYMKNHGTKSRSVTGWPHYIIFCQYGAFMRYLYFCIVHRHRYQSESINTINFFHILTFCDCWHFYFLVSLWTIAQFTKSTPNWILLVENGISYVFKCIALFALSKNKMIWAGLSEKP